MPISSVHPQYAESQDTWQFLEDFYDGHAAVLKNARKYIPPLDKQSTDDYKKYVERGMFYAALSKTIDALVGGAFNVSPAINLPKSLEYLREDATGNGTSMTELAMQLCVEALKTGRAGLLVDRPIEGGKPYLVMMDADDIRNWRDGEFIVIEDEQLVPKEDDPYEFEEVEGYRELALIDGAYTVRIWRQNTDPKTKKKSEYIIVDVVVPEKFGRPLDYIPFTFLGPNGLDSDVGRPPLLDLANVQKTLTAVAADYALAIHLIAVPTPYITGLQPEDNFELRLGPSSAIILPDAASKVGFAEFSGQGLGSIEKYMQQLQETMAALGARVAEAKNQKTLVETATGARAREALATSTLGSVIATVEMALNKSVRWAAEWEGADVNQVEIHLNQELVSANMDANLVQALLAAVQAGRLSEQTFYAKLADAGLTEPGVKWDDEIERIKANLNVVQEAERESNNVPNPQQISTTNDDSEQVVDNQGGNT